MKDAVVAADARVSGYDAMMADACPRANLDVAVDDRIGPHAHARCKPGARIDDRGGMNVHGKTVIQWCAWCTGARLRTPPCRPRGHARQISPGRASPEVSRPRASAYRPG